MSSPAAGYATQNHPRFVEELKTLLRIPSISTLPEHAGDCRRAAELLVAELPSAAVVAVGGPGMFDGFFQRVLHVEAETASG